MGKFVISQRLNGDYQFNLKAENGQIILTSEGYNSKAGCEKGIKAVKINAVDNSKFDIRTAVNGRYYFVLKGENGEIIGKSQLYESPLGRDNGIESVKYNALSALIEDFTI